MHALTGRRAAEAAAASNGGASISGRGDEVVAARPAATKRFVKQQVQSGAAAAELKLHVRRHCYHLWSQRREMA